MPTASPPCACRRRRPRNSVARSTRIKRKRRPMARIEARLAALGLVLPPAFAPPPGVVLPFVDVRLIGNRGIISGHSPQSPEGPLAQPLGKVGRELTLEQGYAAAKLSALSMLGSLQRALGDLDRITQWGRISAWSIPRRALSGNRP